VSDTGVKNFRLVDRTSMLRQLCSAQHFKKGCVDLVRATKRFWKTDELKFWFYPRTWRRLSEKWTPLFTKNWESQFYVHAKHWSCSIANAQNTAQAELDITKFVST